MIKTANLIVVTGAARSGKSQFAEELVAKLDKPVAYLATAQALDPEMVERIARHQERRPEAWTTFEEPLDLAEVIMANSPKYPVWLLDCVTLYLSNLLFQEPATKHFLENPGTSFLTQEVEGHILTKVQELLDKLKQVEITLVAVTNEIGWGLVPLDPLSRVYRDIVGKVNQLLAREATEVYLVTVGIPTKLK